MSWELCKSAHIVLGEAAGGKEGGNRFYRTLIPLHHLTEVPLLSSKTTSQPELISHKCIFYESDKSEHLTSISLLFSSVSICPSLQPAIRLLMGCDYRTHLPVVLNDEEEEQGS